jgi:hypothetical protein
MRKLTWMSPLKKKLKRCCPISSKKSKLKYRKKFHKDQESLRRKKPPEAELKNQFKLFINTSLAMDAD